LASRLAVLSVALFLALSGAGCLKAAATVGDGNGCLSCHAGTSHAPPAASCDGCHRGNPGAARKELAHARLLTGRAAEHLERQGAAVTEGARLVEDLACRRCHVVGGRGNDLATDLDRVVGLRDQAALQASITTPVDGMPAFGLDESQAEAVVAYLLGGASQDRGGDVYRVSFTRGPGRGRTVFEQRCGGCHRALTRLGPLGTGRDGPDLSGLFTEFHPATAPGERPWSDEALGRWVRNPRAVRPTTTMPPVSLEDGELPTLANELGAPGRPEAVARLEAR
jgi:mono/diheme cytochrome c family protein